MSQKKPPPAAAGGKSAVGAAWGAMGSALRHARQTPEQRSAIARHAAEVRWARVKGGKP